MHESILEKLRGLRTPTKQAPEMATQVEPDLNQYHPLDLNQATVDNYIPAGITAPENITTTGIMRAVTYLDWLNDRNSGKADDSVTVASRPAWVSQLNETDGDEFEAALAWVQSLKKN